MQRTKDEVQPAWRSVGVDVDGFLIDIVRDGLLIEIRARNSSSLMRKLAALAANHGVRLLPAALPRPFATADVAAAMDQPRHRTQKMAYCLRKMGAINAVGMRGNVILYEVGARASGIGHRG